MLLMQEPKLLLLDEPAHLGVRVQHDRVGVIITQSNRQRETQLTLLGFVELAALEAGAEEMQLRLGHLRLHPQQEAVVEIRRVVATVLVDDQRAGQANRQPTSDSPTNRNGRLLCSQAVSWVKITFCFV